ncbi:MAG: tRNA (adenosine(37)-N6)-threonylcarbamoyltransferase complex ATPase subunit type 1 TsaE [Patescibacteria group bacterium]
MHYVSKNPQATVRLGAALGRTLRGGEVVTLRGNLGGGKTYFAKGIARGMGIRQRITSPTFVLMRVYRVRHGRIRYFCHVDAYRTKTSHELQDIGLTELAGQPDTVTVVEWADRVPDLLRPYKKITVHCTVAGPTRRTITVRRNRR